MSGISVCLLSLPRKRTIMKSVILLLQIAQALPVTRDRIGTGKIVIQNVRYTKRSGVLG